VEVSAPQTVVTELMQGANDTLLVHLLNYNVAREPAVRNIGLSLRLPQGKSVQGVSVLSPDEDAPQSVTHTIEAGRVRFSVPQLKTYSLAVVKLAGGK
jgi:hypothetical protein